MTHLIDSNIYVRIAKKERSGTADRASFAGGAFQPFAVDNSDALSADVKDVRVLQFIERIGDRFTIYAEALGEVLMGQSSHFIPFRSAQQQRGDARDQSFESHLFQLPFGVDQPLADSFKYPHRDFGLG